MMWAMGRKEAEKTTKRHNLGGVHCGDETWRAIKVRYKAQKAMEETFAAWVRRKLLA
jgi:hypothetical protein